MNLLIRLLPAAVLTTAFPLFCSAQAADVECPVHEVEAHVRQEIAVYGPLSVDREYFAFVYLREGVLSSAVIRGNVCGKAGHCTLNTAPAAALIPKGAKVLGEWHTHPHDGAPGLSMDDVRGARNNRHIRCYAAFYARPNGDIMAWDPQETSVPTAMNSRVLIGNYRELAAQPELSAQARP